MASSDAISSGEHKKVLIITYYWPPAGGAGVQRFLKFVKYFPEYGIDPVVLTCFNPTYPMRDPTLAEDIPDGIPVHYARTVEPFGLYSLLSGTSPEKAADPTTVLGSGELGLTERLVRWLRANILVPDARSGWVLFARHKARKLISEYRIDTIITTGPPHSTHFIGHRLKRKTGVRWIADFRDPWTDIHYNRALPRMGLTEKRDARMEARILRTADEITVTAPGTARYFSRKVDRSYHTIPNGFDPDDFLKPADRKQTRDQSGETGPAPPFCIRHVGSITETSVPVNLLRVLSKFPETDIRIEFIGTVHPDVQKYAAEFGLGDRIHFRSYVPHREATVLMQEADLNLVVVHRSEDSRILIPGKLYDYLNAGKPVMVIGPSDGDTAAIVRRCRIGETFDYTDETGPEQWLKRLIHARRTGGRPDSENYPAFAPDTREISRYSRPALTRLYAALIQGDNFSEQHSSGETGHPMVQNPS